MTESVSVATRTDELVGGRFAAAEKAHSLLERIAAGSEIRRGGSR